MGVKRGLPLREIPEIPAELVERLSAISVSTAEEFVSYFFSQPEDLARYLAREPSELKDLVEKVSTYVSEDTVEEAKSFTPTHRKTGAKSPYSEEFRQYLEKRRSKK